MLPLYFLGTPAPQILRAWAGSAQNTAGATSLSLDISGAIVGEWVYAFCQNRSLGTSPAISGWTSLGTSAVIGGGTGNGNMTVFRRRKQAGDTTFTLTWTTTAQFSIILQQYTGCDQTTPDEGYATVTITSAANVATSPSATPTSTDRWAVVASAFGNGDSTHRIVTWTPDAALTFVGKADLTTTISEYLNSAVFDSNGPVTQTAHSYTNTGNNAGGLNMNNGLSIIFFLIPATVSSTQTLSPTGTGTAEAFGTDAVTPGAAPVAPSGVSSGEAFGTASLNQTIYASGIASAEAFGSHVVGAGAVTVAPSGIASAEAEGTPTVSSGSATLAPTGLASAEAFGNATLVPGPATVSPSGIASAEAEGSATVLPGPVTVSVSGIASGESFGADTLSVGPVSVLPAGIASAEAFGTQKIIYTLYASGIGTAEAEGNPTLSTGPVLIDLSTWGIPSAEAVGTPSLGLYYYNSFEAGTAGTSVYNLAIGDGSTPLDSSNFTGGGTATIDTTWSHLGTRSMKSHCASATGAGCGWSAATIGAAIKPVAYFRAYCYYSNASIPARSRIITLRNSGGTGWGTVFIGTDGTIHVFNLGGGTDKGNTTFATSAGVPFRVEIKADMTTASAVFVQVRVFSGANIEGSTPDGTLTSGTWSLSTADLGSNFWGLIYTSATTWDLWLDDVAISNSNWIGPLVPPAQTITPSQINSAEAFGNPALLSPFTISGLSGIPTGEAEGVPTLSQVATILPAGIATAYQSGVAALSSVVTVLATGIASAEALGAATVILPAYMITPAGIASAYASGAASLSASNQIAVTGVDSAEAFGTPALLPGPVGVSSAGAIGTGEAFGTQFVTKGGVVLFPVGVDPGEAFGDPALTGGTVSITSVGAIGSAQAFGAALVRNVNTVSTIGIGGAEAFGNAVLTLHTFLRPAGIVSAEALGRPDLSGKNWNLLMVHLYDPVEVPRLHDPVTLVERVGEATVGTAVGYPRS